jgi:hypothetical protein
LRDFFQKGDQYVRWLLIAIAVGGTALIAKYGITEFSLLPPYVDVLVKRLGPAAALLTVILYSALLISKRVFKLSSSSLDRTFRRNELCFYVCTALLCLTVVMFFAGLPIEGDLPSY